MLSLLAPLIPLASATPGTPDAGGVFRMIGLTAETSRAEQARLARLVANCNAPTAMVPWHLGMRAPSQVVADVPASGGSAVGTDTARRQPAT